MRKHQKKTESVFPEFLARSHNNTARNKGSKHLLAPFQLQSAAKKGTRQDSKMWKQFFKRGREQVATPNLFLQLIFSLKGS